uniref:Uncharacterized protein n=1 Tax=Zea mays TaxID=4577 RepID=C0P8V0_MAIZE|nr:unknown [Zea mays]
MISSTSLGVMISGGDSMMLSPATLMSIPRFSHSVPNIEPTPGVTSRNKINILSPLINSARFLLTLGIVTNFASTCYANS